MKFAVITLFLFSLLFPLIADGANTSGGALMIVPNQFVDTGDLIDNTNNNNMRGRDEWWFINATVPRTNVDIQAVFDGWDGYLYVYDENLNQIASNDDGPSGVYESQIVMDMDNSITYYICIDEFSASTGTRTFTLHVNADIIWDPPPSPGPISNVSPIDGAIEQPLNTVLAWDFGNNTEFYDLYLDTVDPPITIIVDNAIAEGSGSYNPVSFAQNTVYYWQVISRNTISRLETASSIYSFQTTFGDDIVEIGNGTETNLSLPIEPYWGYSYSQSIYLQEEINTPNSRIETIWYHYNQAGTLSHSQDWVIYMGHTDFVAFENGNDWVPASELTEVYNGPLPTIPADGWIEFEIQVPFMYNNVNNLVIAVEDNQASYDSSSEEFYCTSLPTARSIQCQHDSNNPDPASPPEGTLRNAIANVRLELDHFGYPVFEITPENLTITTGIGYMELDWDDVISDQDDNPVLLNEYRIYGATESVFDLNTENLIGTSTTSAFVHSNLTNRTMFYSVVAIVNR